MPNSLEQFRLDSREWLKENCPASMREQAKSFDLSYGGRNPSFVNEDAKIWMQRMADKGFTAPTWPIEYGGAGLTVDEAKILKQEMEAINARPALTGHGLWMLGPALMEFGNEEQKQRFIPDIVQGNIRWCQGYSEPGAGSDLANVQTKAVDMGDHYLVNGTKIWTTDAHKADWIFCLVRTNIEVKKQAGISFLLIDMQSEGVSVSPIELISGETHFCQTFLDNVKVPKANLVGELNNGWTIAKVLLLHERSMMSDLKGFSPDQGYNLLSLHHETVDSLSEQDQAVYRDKVADCEIERAALSATLQRIFEEEKAGQPSAAGITLKYFGTELDVKEAELALELMGHEAYQWHYDEDSIKQKVAAHFLRSKGFLLGGGTSEIQLNIIAKNILGLPG